jgi:uncharacterized protein YndB with AHSA1/START domain
VSSDIAQLARRRDRARAQLLPRWLTPHLSSRANIRVERVEEPIAFGFTWQISGLPEGDPRRTYVEFTLESAGPGTRLTVVESGFAQLPEEAYRKAYDGNAEGWRSELGELADYLDAV